MFLCISEKLNTRDHEILSELLESLYIHIENDCLDTDESEDLSEYEWCIMFCNDYFDIIIEESCHKKFNTLNTCVNVKLKAVFNE